MESLEEYINGRSLDELLKGAEVMQRNILDIKVLDQAKDNNSVSEISENKIGYSINAKDSLITIGRMGHNTAKVLFDGVLGLGRFIGYCYTLPSSVRRLIEKKKKGVSLNELEKSVLSEDASETGWFGLLNLFGALTGSFISIVEISKGEDMPNFLSYPALAYFATNTLSGLYEWYRHEKNKLKNEGRRENGK